MVPVEIPIEVLQTRDTRTDEEILLEMEELVKAEDEWERVYLLGSKEL
ncbi:hypothetical protein [Clostridium sp. 3-3]|nr:hypothetical protein [Clostridium sp. 3-3]